jgi:hypothetical protein
VNLYDKDDGFRCFTLDEANAMLPDIIVMTEKALQALGDAQNRMEAQEIIDQFSAQDKFESESANILQQWTQQMVALQVYPKGYFTVDFKSPVPDTLFCWTYGEEEITHIHKVYESFNDRIPIKNKTMPGFEQSLN